MPENTPDFATIAKSIDDISSKIDSFAKKDDVVLKDDVKALTGQIDNLRKEVADIKVGAPNFTKSDTRGFKNDGEFFKAVWEAGDPARRGPIDERLLGKAAGDGMNLTVGPDGGYAFPPAFNTSIMEKVIADSDNLLNIVDRITVEGSESITLLAPNETSRVNGSRWGGIQGYWKNELSTMSSSKPGLREVKLEPHELYVFGYVSDKALRNNVTALSNYLNRAAVDEIAFKVGDAIVNGTGVSMPKGLMASNCKIDVAKETNQAAASIVEANIAKMFARMAPKGRSRAVWLANIDIQPQLDTMVTVVKNVAGSENVGGVARVGLYDPAANTLKGRPIIYSEYCQTLGTSGDLILLDPMGYVAATRGSLDTQMSMHLKFDNAQSCFRFIFEVDGQAYLQSAVTPYKGSNTLSSIITLATR